MPTKQELQQAISDFYTSKGYTVRQVEIEDGVSDSTGENFVCTLQVRVIKGDKYANH